MHEPARHTHETRKSVHVPEGVRAYRCENSARESDKAGKVVIAERAEQINRTSGGAAKMLLEERLHGRGSEPSAGAVVAEKSHVARRAHRVICRKRATPSNLE